MNKHRKSASADSIAQDIKALLSDQAQFDDFVDYFFEKYDLKRLLELCGYNPKRKQHKGVDILKYLVKIAATKRSFYYDIKNGYAVVDFKLDTIYRFLNDASIDWMKFLTILSYQVFRSIYDPTERKPIFFVVDDTRYDRPYSNYAQGVSYQRDHNKGENYIGYRLCLLSVYWNGYSFPVSAVLVSTQDEEKMIYENIAKTKHRAEAVRNLLLNSSSIDVMVYQLRLAQSVGFNCRYALFDSWYSYSRTIERVRELGLEAICMLKAGSRQKYRHCREELSIAEIFQRNRDKPFPFLIEVDAIVRNKKNQKEALSYPLLLLYCENRHRSREYFCLASTQTGLPVERILEYYHYRWSIEQFIKDSKNPNLDLTHANRSLDLTGMTAYISVVLIRYLIILLQREEEQMSKERSIQEQFYKLADEIITADYAESFYEGIRSGLDEIFKHSDLSKEEIEELFSRGASKSEKFVKVMKRLPEIPDKELKD